MLNRMVYLSDAAPGFKPDDLDKILATSRKNNAAVGLTGLMIFHELRFFQVLEGEMQAVMSCFNRIMRDPRHENLQILETGAIEARAFGQWRMAYSRVQELPAESREAVFSIYDMVPPNSEDRGDDEAVRLLVRDFLASYDELRVNR